jgi:hypothetical protein
VADTVRISVHVPLPCRRWLTETARAQGRFVSDVLVDQLERHGANIAVSSTRARRAAVPEGTIHSIVIPTTDRRRLDDLARRLGTTRSALVTEVVHQAIATSDPAGD